MKICSLLPSATEIIFALGLGDCLTGVSHECDFPEETRTRRVLTRCAFDSVSMSPIQIDQTVTKLAIEQKSLYEIDLTALQQADPDLIITQDLCHVCAITVDEVEKAVKALPRRPQILRLSPAKLEDVFSDILRVADATGVPGNNLVEDLRLRIKRITSVSALPNRPTVACIEWFDPLWSTGHWVPEMVQLAGGEEILAGVGKPSRRISWQNLEDKNPDFLFFMPCGSTLDQSRHQFQAALPSYPWHRLKAFQNHQVFLVDANSYFSRSGPRLVEGVEILAEILHPEFFSGLAPEHSYERASLNA